MKRAVRADDPLFLRMPRSDIARLKRVAADVNMSVNAYIRALINGQTPKPAPASDMQYSAIAGNAIVEAIRLVDCNGPRFEITSALRQAKLALLDNILVARSDDYDDAVVEKEVADYRWRTTTKAKRRA